jgi:thiamine-phosphate diphosphorylase
MLLVVADLAYLGDDEARWLRALRDVSAAAVGAPVGVQVRAKERSGVDRLRLAALARDAVSGEVPLFLNGDAVAAVALGYDGVHWPEAEVPSESAVAGASLRWRSAAAHSVAAQRAAEAAGCDVTVAGAVFDPGSKPGHGAGLEMLTRLVEASSIPVIAIGGITPERVSACLDAGASGVAVVSGVLGVDAPGAAIEAYAAALTGRVRPAGARKGGFQ